MTNIRESRERFREKASFLGKKRMLSLLLAFVMMVGMIPITGTTAYAATEVKKLDNLADTAYAGSATQYFTYDNYLYKAYYNNINLRYYVKLAAIKQNLVVKWNQGHASTILLDSSGNEIPVSNLPKVSGESILCYDGASHNNCIDSTKPIVTITCLTLNQPTWNWNGTSSATAVSTPTENANIYVTVKARLSSNTVNAKNCKEVDKITYTASATLGGTTYTDTKLADGSAGPHSLIYSKSGNVITETCKNNCGHKETATLKMKSDVSLSYTGSAIQPLEVQYSANWQGGKNLSIVYSSNIDVGMATGSITIGGATATQTFTIVRGEMKNVTADNVSVFYDGNAHSIMVKNVPTGATVTYSMNGKTYDKTNPAFTEIGTTTVYYKVEKDNYNTVSDSATVTISQAENSWTTEPSMEGWTYGENPKTPNEGTPKFGSDVKVEYKPANVSDDCYTAKVPTEAGKYKVRFSVKGNENYTDLSKVLDLTIAKVNVTVKAEDNEKTYGQSDPQFTWNVTSGKVVGSDKLVINVGRTDHREDADTYTIKATEPDNANPNYDIEFVDGTFTINKKMIDISWGNTNFIYDKSEKLPTATAIGMEYDDEIGLNVTGSQINAGTDYIATVVGITGAKKDNYQLPTDVTITFAIDKAQQAAPSGLVGTAETIDGKEDGKITGATVAMEYRKESGAYTKIDNTELTKLAKGKLKAGIYNVRFSETDNYKASDDCKIVIGRGRKLKVLCPEIQVGYEISVPKDKTEFTWNDSVEFTFTLKEGYSKLDTFVVKVNGNPIELDKDGRYIAANAEEDIAITVEGVADITAPDVEIILDTNKWNKFFHDITFGLFFKDIQKVTITADDKGSGVDKIYYYLSTTELTEKQVKALSDSDWTEYKGAFNLNPQDEYVIYAKAVDYNNNIKYISSEKGIIIDSIAPIISGIVNGETYYGDTTFTVADKYLVEVKVDGNLVNLTDGKYTIPADGKEHTVVATDKSNNVSKEIKITVITIASLGNIIENITTDNVEIKDKLDLEKAKDNLEKILEDYKDNLTDDEKKVIEDEIDRIEKKLDNAKSTLEALNKTTNSPATGDNDNIWMWFVLFIVSGSGLLGMTAYSRNRKLKFHK